MDFCEKRRVSEKFEMGNKMFHEFYRKAFATMRKGEEAWVIYGPKEHGGNYFRLKHFEAKPEEEKKDITDQIYLKFNVDRITRNPVQEDKSTYALRILYYNTVRDICKKLFTESEYVNARDLYKRVLADFENMPKTMREALSEEEKKERLDILVTLNNNIALCFLKLDKPGDAFKFAEVAISKDGTNAKAHFLKYKSAVLKGDFDAAKDSLKQAITLDPGNKSFRTEFTSFNLLKSAKEKEWRGKMEGFLQGEKYK